MTMGDFMKQNAIGYAREPGRTSSLRKPLATPKEMVNDYLWF